MMPARPQTALPPQRPAPNYHLLDFEEIQPDLRMVALEKPGNVDYNGTGLQYIPAEAHLPQVGIPAKLQELIDHAWSQGAAPATARTGARNGVVIGKPVHIWAQQNNASVGTPYAKQVAPLHSANAMVQAETAKMRANFNWSMVGEMPRVSAYTFRGDKRTPVEIAEAGGFYPPITRRDKYYVDSVIQGHFKEYMKARFGTDVTPQEFNRAYAQIVTQDSDRELIHSYLTWQALVQNEAYHVGIMLAQEDLKGYISSTKSVSVAKGFCSSKAGTNGWVYVMRIAGGFVVPDKKKHVWTQLFGEQEIAYPAEIRWSEIFGFRQVDQATKKFMGPIFLRKHMKVYNKNAYRSICDLLSGKPQA